MAKADTHKWEFKARFRRHAFGWKSQPAITRIKQAVAEIKMVAKKDPMLAAEGAIAFLERVSPALERQIASLLFQRLAKSRDKEKVMALARSGHQLDGPSDVLKEPFVLEFLGLGEKSAWRERELEQAIIDRIEEFLLELGKGFCFVARQKRVTLEGDHFASSAESVGECRLG